MSQASSGNIRVKAGTSDSAAADRHQSFVNAYIANGRNATQAAITAGYSAKTAAAAASRLLKDVKISAMVGDLTEKIQVTSALTVERTLREVASIAFFDPRKMFNADGSLKRPDEWDDETAAAISRLEVEEEFSGTGTTLKVASRTNKLRLWDKNAALDKAMRHLGLYEKDNAQRGTDLALQVVMVGPA